MHIDSASEGQPPNQPVVEEPEEELHQEPEDQQQGPDYAPEEATDPNEEGLQLDWPSRLLLIQGIAQGLCYLHKENVVHLDIKPSNILLDRDMSPKISDFGMARVLNHKGVDISSDIGTIAGTLGYMPPEYITDGTLSKKHDVYGFGVTLLEVISGMSRFKRASGQASVQWAWEARQAGGMMELLEPSLFDTSQLKEIERCVEVGLLCTQFDPADRPDMADALEMLRGGKALRTPVRPVLLLSFGSVADPELFLWNPIHAALSDTGADDRNRTAAAAAAARSPGRRMGGGGPAGTTRLAAKKKAAVTTGARRRDVTGEGEVGGLELCLHGFARACSVV
ncbi:hypothetical protein BS78_K259300 [Paspalum vaginatum]|uniref:Protein kinase domain-containing protein n=1 Tax=Paspalum vaginatum TaxID=158149 RepID=A0A9W8CGN4_9POAL|nr:hypothetical protein BS78_K259300 [Paspalum vaginatum]